MHVLTARPHLSRILQRREKWGRRNDRHLTALTEKTNRIQKLEPQRRTDLNTTAIVEGAAEQDAQMVPQQEGAAVLRRPRWDHTRHKELCVPTVGMRITQLNNVGSFTLSSTLLQPDTKMPTW